MTQYIIPAALLLASPILGGLLEGLSRIISARMQGRVGPPLLQPFFDVIKLFQKSRAQVSRVQEAYVTTFLVFTVFACGVFFFGGDLLVFFFCLTLANVFLVLAAYAAGSPFSHAGAERELFLVLAYEPMFILALVGMYIVTGSFDIATIVAAPKPLILFLPGCFLGMIPVICIKLQKSPFDLSTSHHAHQELVKGATTDFSASTLGLVEIAHWFKYAYLTAFILLFFGSTPILAGVAIAATYSLVVFIDNAFGRFKMGQAAKVVWIVTLAVGFGNVLLVYVIKYFTAYAGWFGVP